MRTTVQKNAIARKNAGDNGVTGEKRNRVSIFAGKRLPLGEAEAVVALEAGPVGAAFDRHVAAIARMIHHGDTENTEKIIRQGLTAENPTLAENSLFYGF